MCYCVVTNRAVLIFRKTEENPKMSLYTELGNVGLKTKKSLCKRVGETSPK